MAAKKKLQRKESASVPEKVVGPVVKVEEPKGPSRHANTHFITGKLGLDLANANDEVQAALKQIGFKPHKHPVSTQPFTTDKNYRAFLAGFVADPSHRTIVMPGPDFKSSFGSRAERAPMSEETKAYLKEKGLEKKMLRPKKAAGGISIQDLCKELNIHPRDARKALRKAKIQKPELGWYWATREEADSVLKQAGLLGGKKEEPKKVEKKPEAPAKATKKETPKAKKVVKKKK